MGRTADLDALLGAGVKDESDDKHISVSRLIESLAATLAPPPLEVKTVERQLNALRRLHEVSYRERLFSTVPFVRPKVIPGPSGGSSDRVKEVVLLTLEAIFEAASTPEWTCGGAGSSAKVAALLRDLDDVVHEFAPCTLFDAWSPAVLPAEVPLALMFPSAVHPLRTFASHTSERSPARLPIVAGLALAASARPQHWNAVTKPGRAAGAAPLWSSAWSTDRVSGDSVVWGVTFPSSVPVSSVKLYWEVRSQ